MFFLLLATLSLACQAQARAVFAHFMVGNTANYSDDDWRDDFEAAKAAHIDAFALNMGNGDPTNNVAIPTAFSIADSVGFKLFFSFDYAAAGAWEKGTVTSMIQQYSTHASYWTYENKPLVSTFEGTANAVDWQDIKAATDCYFIPDYSSKGADGALALGHIDGLFSWNAWPNGPNNMTVDTDASYHNAMPETMPYMMPVSPWFYTNLPGWQKNWVWKGDTLWHDRWLQILWWQPQFVEIISWNDYGESHYVGPIRSSEVLEYGKAPLDYITGMDHDGWRDMLPYWIDMYKFGKATINQEVLTTWYRINPAQAGSDGGTTGNTASQGQQEYSPSELLEDRIFYMALLTSESEVSVTIGGADVPASWSTSLGNGVGVYFGSVPIDGKTGEVKISVKGLTVTGKTITTDCQNGLTNWNAWVGSARQPAQYSATTQSY